MQLAHSFLTASAKVDSNSVTMLEDNGSENAEAPLTVVNTQGLELPNTGDLTIWIVSASGIVLMTAALVFILLTCRKKKSEK